MEFCEAVACYLLINFMMESLPMMVLLVQCSGLGCPINSDYTVTIHQCKAYYCGHTEHHSITWCKQGWGEIADILGDICHAILGLIYTSAT